MRLKRSLIVLSLLLALGIAAVLAAGCSDPAQQANALMKSINETFNSQVQTNLGTVDSQGIQAGQGLIQGAITADQLKQAVTAIDQAYAKLQPAAAKVDANLAKLERDNAVPIYREYAKHQRPVVAAMLAYAKAVKEGLDKIAAQPFDPAAAKSQAQQFADNVNALKLNIAKAMQANTPSGP